MKRFLLLPFWVFIFAPTFAHFNHSAASAHSPWDVSPIAIKLEPKTWVTPCELPGVWFYTCTYIPAAQTGTGYANLAIRLALADFTGNYYAVAKIKVYCHLYGITGYTGTPPFQRPTYGWEWGYKDWEVEVPPNTNMQDQNWMLTGGETFNTYLDGEGLLAVNDNDYILDSWLQE